MRIWIAVVLHVYLRLWQLTSGQQSTAGVYLSLNGTVYTNSSDILITEIGETLIDHLSSMPSQNNGLQCITDRKPCCRFEYRTGEWRFPNGTGVPLKDDATTFYRNRGHDDGTVNLNRVSTDVMSPTGMFCCEVPDATDVNQTVCANIVNTSTVPTTQRQSQADHDDVNVMIIIGGSLAAAGGVAIIITIITIITLVIIVMKKHQRHQKARPTESHQHSTAGDRDVTQYPNQSQKDVGHDYLEPADYYCDATKLPEEQFGVIVHHDHFTTDGYKATQSTQEDCGVVTKHDYVNTNPRQSPATQRFQHPATDDNYVITHLTQEDYDRVNVNPSDDSYTYTTMR